MVLMHIIQNTATEMTWQDFTNVEMRQMLIEYKIFPGNLVNSLTFSPSWRKSETNHLDVKTFSELYFTYTALKMINFTKGMR